MATKDTLANANIALKAQLEKQQAQIDALMAQANTASPKKAKAAKPLVSRGYFKTRDAATDKWLDDTSRPCVIIAVPDAKPRKMTEENLAKEIGLHAKIAAAFKALS